MQRTNRKELKARDKNGRLQQPQFSFVMSADERRKLEEIKAAGYNISQVFRTCIEDMHTKLESK